MLKQIQDISFRERIRLNLVSSMKSAGINQVQLADRLGISKGTVNNWVRGNNSPDVDMVPRICKELGISILSLYSPLEFEREELADNNGLSVQKPLTPEAMRIASRYDELDDFGKETMELVLNRESERVKEIRRLNNQLTAETAEENLVTFLLPYSVQPASAGTGMFLGPDNFEMLRVQRNEITRRAAFSVPVSGNSMEPQYRSGDILMVEAANDIRVGEIGVFTLNGEGYVKQRGDDELISLNPEYEPIRMDESVRCNGRVIGILEPEWIVKE